MENLFLGLGSFIAVIYGIACLIGYFTRDRDNNWSIFYHACKDLSYISDEWMFLKALISILLGTLGLFSIWFD